MTPPKSTATMPTNRKVAAETDPVRRAILGAIQRLLLSQPRHVRPGASSISDLAREAEVARHHLYQTHPDLKARFEYLRDRAQTPTQAEASLTEALEKAKQEITRLEQLQTRTRTEALNWKGLCEVLQRAINVLQEELRQEQLKTERRSRRLAMTPTTPTAEPVIPIRGRINSIREYGHDE